MSNTKTSGLTDTGLLTVALVVLKLTGIITWSWWWVLCPLWIGFAFLIGLVLCALMLGLITKLP